MTFPFQLLVFTNAFLALLAFPRQEKLKQVEVVLARFARRRWRMLLFAGVLPVLACLIQTIQFGEPVPAVHDEFAYLLAADTFAHGRLTNPAHPMREHFETYHILQQPSYQAKYPPAQGAFLALGQRLTGYPIAGVWLSLGLAFAAVTWMLQGWVRPLGVFYATLLCFSSVWLLRLWGLSYWGGAVGVLGGALFLGGLRRFGISPRIGNGLAAAAGLAVLANGRPYEGLVFSLTATILFLRPLRLVRRFPVSRLLVAALPAALLLAANFAWIGYYNFRVTGDALEMPYQEWSRQYMGLSLADELSFSPEIVAETRARIVLPSGAEQMRPDPDQVGDNLDVGLKLARLWNVLVGLFLAILLFASLFSASGRPRRFWILTLVTLTAVLLQNTPGYAHYLAPAFGALMLLAAYGAGALDRLRIGRVRGVQVRLAVGIGCLASLGMFVLTNAETPWAMFREGILEQLQADGGKHVVIVKYRPEHNMHHEWVYNGSDIDHSPVIWGRDLGTKRNRPLLDYYPGRTIWEVDADLVPPKLTRLRETR